MKWITSTLVTVAIFGASSGAASAAPSCVAVITTYEAQLAPGFVGGEVSGLATSGPGLGSGLVSPLARQHLASFEDCRAAEE